MVLTQRKAEVFEGQAASCIRYNVRAFCLPRTKSSPGQAMCIEKVSGSGISRITGLWEQPGRGVVVVVVVGCVSGRGMRGQWGQSPLQSWRDIPTGEALRRWSGSTGVSKESLPSQLPGSADLPGPWHPRNSHRLGRG